MVFLCRTFSFRNNIREKKLSKFFQGFSRCITKYSNTDTDFLRLRNIKRTKNSTAKMGLEGREGSKRQWKAIT